MSMLKSANTEGIIGDYVMGSVSEAPFSTQVDNINNDYILITNLMHRLLFIHKILYSSTGFEP